MDALSYSAKVKTFKQSEICESLMNLTVANNDLQANIQRIVNELDLSQQMDHWVITKGTEKALKSSGAFHKSFSNTVLNACATIASLIPSLLIEVKSFKEELWDGKLLNLRQANLLNLIEYLSFWIDYTRMVYDVLVTMSNKDVDVSGILDKVDLRWINGTEGFYRSFFIELLSGSKAILANLRDIPEINIDPTSLDVLESTSGAGKIDLLKQGFGIHLANPIFWVGLLWNKINLMRIEQMRRKNEMFAMKISQAINLKNGGEDPQLEHRIEVYQNEIIKNSAAIEKIENSYA